MQKKTIIILAAIVAAVIIPIIITLLALTNPPWARSMVFVNVESFITRIMLSRVDAITIPKGQGLDHVAALIQPRLSALQEGNVQVVTATDIFSGAYKSTKHNKAFVVATIEPCDVEAKPHKLQRKIIESVDNLALKEKVNAIVESTTSDLARSNAWGRRQVRELHAAGVIRLVIFDGGHHVGTLPLQPDVILAPVIKYGNTEYISHWYTRDSVPLLKLESAIRKEHIGCVIAELPRSGIPVKNPAGMELLTMQALLKIARMAKSSSSMSSSAAQTNALPPKHRGIATPRIRPVNRDALFISLEVGETPRKENVLRSAKQEIALKTRRRNDIKRIYIGITCGKSNFPHVGKSTGFTGEDIERYLNDHLPYKIVVLSEPFSTWDIYASRLR
ncbi:MAG TPA: hypothetical protein VGK02_01285 [Candidatus Aquicultor sp.]